MNENNDILPSSRAGRWEFDIKVSPGDLVEAFFVSLSCSQSTPISFFFFPCVVFFLHVYFQRVFDFPNENASHIGLRAILLNYNATSNMYTVLFPRKVIIIGAVC